MFFMIEQKSRDHLQGIFLRLMLGVFGEKCIEDAGGWLQNVSRRSGLVLGHN